MGVISSIIWRGEVFGTLAEAFMPVAMRPVSLLALLAWIATSTGCAHHLDMTDRDAKEWERTRAADERGPEGPKLGRYAPRGVSPAVAPNDAPPSAVHPQVGSATTPKDAPSRPQAAQVLIGRGTCFAINGHGLLVTAHHVIAGAKTVFVKFQGTDQVEASVVRVSEVADLAVLKIDRDTPEYLAVGESHTSRLGTPVFTIGFPDPTLLGFEPKFTNGTISALSGLHDEAAFMQITVPIQPGNSGGPLVSVRGGEVVGIVQSSAAELPFAERTGSLPQGINFASKAENLRALLKDAPPERQPARDREEAIDRATAAVCRVVTVNTAGD